MDRLCYCDHDETDHKRAGKTDMVCHGTLGCGCAYYQARAIRGEEEDHEYRQYRDNAVKALEHLEGSTDDETVCAAIAQGWAGLAIAEAMRL